MQTFLPFSNFEQSAKFLDWRRLGKQRVETKQIYNALTVPSAGWANHPATKMWRGCELALLHYGLTMCREWVGRGYNDTMIPWYLAQIAQRSGPVTLPKWLGDSTFHISHQSNLLRKDSTYYSPLFPNVPNDLPYIWPAP